MVDTAAAPVLAILTRAPSSAGKSRLFQALGIEPDPDLSAALLLDTLDATLVPGVRRVVVVTPASGCDEVRAMAGDVEVMPQPEGDLGERMRATMAALFAQGAPVVALMGSDVPHIVSATIADALALATRDPDAIVLGPSTDGGYYLVAATQVPPIFSNIEWGRAQVLAQTERAAAAAGLQVLHLSSLIDVDTPDDLRQVVATRRALRTAEWVKRRARTAR